MSNNFKLAIKLDLDGAYIPSFNKKMNFYKNNIKKKFIVIGSAHSVKEMRVKEKQCVELIFLSPLFQSEKNKHFLNPIKFNFLASKTKKKIIALGGITDSNYKKLRLIKAYGFAGISYFKNNDRVGV